VSESPICSRDVRKERTVNCSFALVPSCDAINEARMPKRLIRIAIYSGIDSGMLSNSPSTSRLHPLASRARRAYDFNIVDSYVIRFRSDDQVYRRSPFCETVEYVYKMSRLFFPRLSNTLGRCTAFNETLIKFLSPQIFVIKYSALERNSVRDVRLIS
jgi:hypothetical protein